jgi:hypothetical protein
MATVPCGDDPELWYSKDLRDQAEAVRICRGCAALQDCYKWVMGTEPPGDRHGIVAGLTPVVRNKIAKQTGDLPRTRRLPWIDVGRRPRPAERMTG